MFQPLEPRRLLSAPPVHNPDTNVVTVSGTDADDFITITHRGNDLLVTLGGERFAFDAGAVERVEVFGGGGDDRIIGTRADVTLAVFGEAGNDVIFGSAADDELAGGTGRDRIFGRDGNDALAGDEGDDYLVGGDGDDVLADSAGNDFLTGNGGDDTFEDRDGRGTAVGGAGADRATRFNDRYRIVGVESVDFAPGVTDPAAAAPQLHLYVQWAADGLVTVFVEATHLQSGFEKAFGPAHRIGTRFETTVRGIDVAPDPTAPRDAVTEVDTQPYVLGRLDPGTYTFNVRTPGRGDALAALTFVVTADGLPADTPNAPTAAGPGTVLGSQRVRGSVTGPAGDDGGPTAGPARQDTPTLGIGNGFLPRMGVSTLNAGVSTLAAPGLR